MDIIFSDPRLLFALPVVLALLVWFFRAPRLKGLACVVDGDSIEINGQRCRLSGIDAAEYNQTLTSSDGHTRNLGTQARRTLAELIDGRPVVCKVLGIDTYGRKLVRCYNHAGEDVAHALVLKGLAEVYVFRNRPQSNRYRFAQFRAKWFGRGLWKTKGNSPQAWRQSRG